MLTAEFAAPLPDRAGLAADLAGVLAGARDFEDTLDLLRRWANERRFQVGVQLLRRELDGGRRRRRARRYRRDRARPRCCRRSPRISRGSTARCRAARFAVVAMGRLGSREMSLASDLDLILIYDAPADSDGVGRAAPAGARRPITPGSSQRLIAAITAPTAEGRLYEVDMRLRPSGESGPIASSLAAFARYQREAAWTWEHMALTRARPVAGDAALCAPDRGGDRRRR